MSNVLIELEQKGLIKPPSFVSTNTCYLTSVGSHAYGVADTSTRNKLPDFDVYGWCIPPKTVIFPHLAGFVRGFGPEPPSFDQWQNAHVIDKEANGGHGKEWDFQIYGIVRYFHLCYGNNPNMIDSLFTPENCVLYCNQMGRMVRDSRSLFISKLAWKTFRGYCSMQIKKARDVMKHDEIRNIWEFEEAHGIPRSTTYQTVLDEIANRGSTSLTLASDVDLQFYKNLFDVGTDKSKRFEARKIHGQDNKFLYHLIRLYDEAEQLLTTGDMDIQRSKETMKAIRRGDWTMEQVEQWTIEKDKALEVAYSNCTLPDRPPIEPIKQLLINCLELHYGSMEKCIVQTGWAENALMEINAVLEKNKRLLFQ